MIILRSQFGYDVFHWFGQRAQEFLSFTDYGSEFVFGPKYKDHIFAMKVIPVSLWEFYEIKNYFVKISRNTTLEKCIMQHIIVVRENTQKYLMLMHITSVFTNSRYALS